MTDRIPQFLIAFQSIVYLGSLFWMMQLNPFYSMLFFFGGVAIGLVHFLLADH